MKRFEYSGNPVSKTFESLINGVNDPLINDNNDEEWIKEHDKRMAEYEKEMEDPHDCSTCKYRRIDDISCETCGPDYENWVSEVERNINVTFPCITEINCTRYNGFVHCGVRWNHIGVGSGADEFFDNAKWTGELRDGGHGWIVEPSKLRGMNNPIMLTSETSEESVSFVTRDVNNLSSQENESMIDIDDPIIRFLDSFFEHPYPYAVLTICHSGRYLDRDDGSTWDIYECQHQIDILPKEIRGILSRRRTDPTCFYTKLIERIEMPLRKFISNDYSGTDPLIEYFDQLSEKRFMQQKSLIIPKLVTFRDIIYEAEKI